MSRATALFEAAIPPSHRGSIDAYMWPVSDLIHSPGGDARLLALFPQGASAAVSEIPDFWGHSAKTPRTAKTSLG